MSQKQIGYFAINEGTPDCACKGENLIVMNNPVEMEKLVRKNFKMKYPLLKKVYSHEVIEGLKVGGHYLFSEKSYKDFLSECISDFPHLFPPFRLVVLEPVVKTMFYQVSWEDYHYNTPK